MEIDRDNEESRTVGKTVQFSKNIESKFHPWFSWELDGFEWSGTNAMSTFVSFDTSRAVRNECFDVFIHPRPPHRFSTSLFGFDDAWMSFMSQLEYLISQLLRDHCTGTSEDHAT